MVRRVRTYGGANEAGRRRTDRPRQLTQNNPNQRKMIITIIIHNNQKKRLSHLQFIAASLLGTLTRAQNCATSQSALSDCTKCEAAGQWTRNIRRISSSVQFTFNIYKYFLRWIVPHPSVGRVFENGFVCRIQIPSLFGCINLNGKPFRIMAASDLHSRPRFLHTFNRIVTRKYVVFSTIRCHTWRYWFHRFIEALVLEYIFAWRAWITVAEFLCCMQMGNSTENRLGERNNGYDLGLYFCAPYFPFYHSAGASDENKLIFNARRVIEIYTHEKNDRQMLDSKNEIWKVRERKMCASEIVPK